MKYIFNYFPILGKLICKIIGHHWYAMDFIEFGWELKDCFRCGISNYYIDKNHHLHKLGYFKTTKKIRKEKCK